MKTDRRTDPLGMPRARGRRRRLRLSRAARSCRPTTRCSTTRSATSWCGTSRARRTWPTATRARPARSASPIATSGPGATNMVTGIATAMMDSSPIVCITGQVGSKLIGSDAFQETDITGVTLPITKHNYLVTRADEVARAVREAFDIAALGPARPGAGRHHQGRAAERRASSTGTPPRRSCRGYRPDHRPISARDPARARADQRGQAAAHPRRPRHHRSRARCDIVRAVRRAAPASRWR